MVEIRRRSGARNSGLTPIRLSVKMVTAAGAVVESGTVDGRCAARGAGQVVRAPNLPHGATYDAIWHVYVTIVAGV